MKRSPNLESRSAGGVEWLSSSGDKLDQLLEVGQKDETDQGAGLVGVRNYRVLLVGPPGGWSRDGIQVGESPESDPCKLTQLSGTIARVGEASGPLRPHVHDRGGIGPGLEPVTETHGGEGSISVIL